MAEGNEVSNEDTETHIQNLANLWRICGNRLKKKIKQSYQTTYSCKDYRGFLRNTSKLTLKRTTLPFTHHASVICALPLTHEIMFYWEIHTELQYLCKRGERLLDWGVESQKI